MTRPLRSASIHLAAVVVWLAMPVAAYATEAVADSTPVQASLQAVLGPTRRLRDYASFVTEKGERATLLLFVMDGIELPAKEPLEEILDCPSMVEGIPLRGNYHVGLVVGAKLINEIAIPRIRPDWVLAFPLKNEATFNHCFWGQGEETESIAFEATKLIRLADFTGDGHAWEFRLVQPNVCGHLYTLLAGYSPRQRRAIVYPIVRERKRWYWEEDLFPSPEKPNATNVRTVWHCGDHGVEIQTEKVFVYNPRQEGWVLASDRSTECEPERPELRAPQ